MTRISKVEELTNLAKRAENIYLYGAGRYGKILEAFFEQNGIRIKSFIVTERTDNKEWRGIDIRLISDIQLGKDDMVILSVKEEYQREILGMIQHTGHDNIIVPLEDIWDDVQGSINIRKVPYAPDERLVQVLIFHRVSYKENDPWGLEIPPERFDEYIRVLSDNYPIIRFEDDWDSIKERSLVITFDDGYYDNYRYALPILVKYGIPATVFVSTGNMNTYNEFWWDRLGRLLSVDYARTERLRLLKMTHAEREREIGIIEKRHGNSPAASIEDRSMTEAELREMAESELITIGAHTVTHSMLSMISGDEQEEEIVSSKKRIESVIGRTVDVFSYPFGGRESYNEDSIEILKKTGFVKSATNYAGIVGRGSDMYQIPRCGIIGDNASEVLNRVDTNWITYS